MIFRWAAYNPVQRGLTNEKLLGSLPKNIQDELIQDSRNKGYVSIDRTKREVEKEIDKLFRIPKNKKICKCYLAEVTEDQIDEFTHYWVGFKNLNFTKDFVAGIVRPACDDLNCLWGGDLSSPFTIKNPRIRKLDLAVFPDPLGSDRHLMISEYLRTKFEDTGISGLVYEECVLGPKLQGGPPIYVAKVVAEGREVLPDIMVKDWICKKHRIPSILYCFKEAQSRYELTENDFQAMPTFEVKGKIYTRTGAGVLTSTWALKIILESKRRNLVAMGYHLGQPFIPAAPKSAIFE